MSFPPKHLPWYWFDRRVYEYAATNVLPYLGWKNPILVYQMGKVGSSSIRNSLFRCRDPKTRLVLGSHEFFPIRTRQLDQLEVEPRYQRAVRDEIAQDQDFFDSLTPSARRAWRRREKFYTEKIYTNYVAKGGQLRVISLVREPIAMNVSLFFQLLESHFHVGHPSPLTQETEQLIDVFVRNYPHVRPITWFDVELKRTLGIDVFQYPFDPDKGFTFIEQDNIRLMVMRVDLRDEVKESAIRSFLGIKDFRLVRSNVAAKKPYGSKYKEFRASFRAPEWMLEWIYGARFARHFFSSAERQEHFEHWGGCGSSEKWKRVESGLAEGNSAP